MPARSWWALWCCAAIQVSSWDIPSFDITPSHASHNWTSREAQYLQEKKCPDSDPVIDEALSLWWDVQLSPAIWRSHCQQSIEHGGWGGAYMARIRGGKLYYTKCTSVEGDGEDLNLLFGLILDLMDSPGLPDMEFTFNIGDQPFTDRAYFAPVPQLHWVSSAGHWTIPIPNPFQLKALWGNRLGDNGMNIQREHSEWAERIPKVYWRGSISLPDQTPYHAIQGTSRMRLLRLADSHPELFDVGVSTVDKDVWWDKLTSAQKAAFTASIKSKTTGWQDSAQQATKYKFVINVSAVLSSWRLAQLLATGALLLLQADSTHELLYNYLTPWVHFVPLKHDLSDAIPKVKWLVANDHVAKRIAKAGFEFFSTKARREDTYCYMFRLLHSLRDLTNGNATETSKGHNDPFDWTEVHPEDVNFAKEEQIRTEKNEDGMSTHMEQDTL